jgi:hypothetical protein
MGYVVPWSIRTVKLNTNGNVPRDIHGMQGQIISAEEVGVQLV